MYMYAPDKPYRTEKQTEGWVDGRTDLSLFWGRRAVSNKLANEFMLIIIAKKKKYKDQILNYNPKQGLLFSLYKELKKRLTRMFKENDLYLSFKSLKHV